MSQKINKMSEDINYGRPVASLHRSDGNCCRGYRQSATWSTCCGAGFIFHDFRRDSNLFSEGVRKPEAESHIQAALKRGFQTRNGEVALGQLLGELQGETHV